MGITDKLSKLKIDLDDKVVEFDKSKGVRPDLDYLTDMMLSYTMAVFGFIAGTGMYFSGRSVWHLVLSMGVGFLGMGLVQNMALNSYENKTQ